MDYNGGWAYQAPSAVTPELTKLVYGDPMQQYRKQQEQMRQQKLQDAENQRKLDNQNRVTKYVNDQTDIKQHPEYATGTAADPLINGQLKDVHDKWIKNIRENPNMTEAEITDGMDADIRNINQTATNIKAARQRIEDGVKGYEKIPGAKTLNLKENAIDRMLYDTDDKGNKVLKKKIDPNQDYVGDEIHENASNYVNGDAALDDVFSREDKQRSPISDVEKTDHAGVKIQSGMKGSIAPYQHPIYDKNGRITGIGTNSEQAIDPDTKKPIPGMQVVDDATFQKFNTPGMMIRLKGDVDKMLTQAGIDPKTVDPTSEKYKLFVKHAMLLAIDKNAKKDITPVDNQTNANFLDKQQAGLGAVLNVQETKAQKAHDEQLSGSNYGRLVDAVNGDPKILDAGTARTVTTGDGKQHHLTDITDVVGGFATNQDGKLPNGTDYNKIVAIYVDRNDPGKLYIQERGDPHGSTYNPAHDSGNLKVLNAKEVENMMRRHGAENGFAKNSNDIDRLLKLKPFVKPAEKKLTVRERHAQAANSEIDTRLPTPVQ